MKRILIVDDEPSIQIALSRLVNMMGLESDIAGSGAEAVDKAGRTHYDLVLLDIRMDDMDGIEALEAIRADGLNTGCPVIMVTAFSNINYVEAAIRHGANDFIVKPFESSVISAKISRLINTRVENRWKYLRPEQQKLLRMTLYTLENAFEAVKSGGQIPYEEFAATADQIITVMENDGIAEVLEAVKDHDGYTFTHSLRVGIYMALFAHGLGGYSRDKLLMITSGGVIHDVGKARSPLHILNKPKELDDHEMLIMMEHVNHTVDMLRNTPGIPVPVIEIAAQHHERMDGSGYPNGLNGARTSVCGRMAAIVDAYVALTDRRIYKPAYGMDRAFEELYETPGGLDKELLGAFRKTLKGMYLDSIH